MRTKLAIDEFAKVSLLPPISATSQGLSTRVFSSHTNFVSSYRQLKSFHIGSGFLCL